MSDLTLQLEQLPVLWLLLAAATLHALWNLAAKRANGNIAIVGIGLLVAGGAGLVLLAFSPTEQFIWTGPAAQYVYLSTVVHILYFYLIGKLYRDATLSVVYPLSRAIGVAGTLFFGAWWFNDALGFGRILGVATVCGSMLALSWSQGGLDQKRFDLGVAGLIGVLIALASPIDKLGVSASSPLSYIVTLMGLTSYGLAAIVLATRRQDLLEVARELKLKSVICGTQMFLSYYLVLIALRREQIHYVAPLRESSIVISFLLGVVVLKESYGLSKALCILGLFLGVILVQLG